jgi:hypothetical protein
MGVRGGSWVLLGVEAVAWALGAAVGAFDFDREEGASQPHCPKLMWIPHIIVL